MQAVFNLHIVDTWFRSKSGVNLITFGVNQYIFGPLVKILCQNPPPSPTNRSPPPGEGAKFPNMKLSTTQQLHFLSLWQHFIMGTKAIELYHMGHCSLNFNILAMSHRIPPSQTQTTVLVPCETFFI